MGLVRTVDPTIEPLTVADGRKQVEIPASNATHNTYLSILIQAAREKIENVTGRAFIEQTFKLALDLFPETVIAIPRPPLLSIESIKYIDDAGVEQTLSNSLFRVGKLSSPGRVMPIFSEVWPVTQNVIEAVVIEFKAGYGTDASTVPNKVLQAIRLTVGNWFENRESVIAGTIAAELPQSALWLINGLKRGGFPGEFNMKQSNVESRIFR